MRGIPTFRRVTIERVRALNSTTAIQAKGSESSSILDFYLNSVHIEAKEAGTIRSEEHTSELQSLMRISYAVFCLKKKNDKYKIQDSTIRRNNKTQHKQHKQKLQDKHKISL